MLRRTVENVLGRMPVYLLRAAEEGDSVLRVVVYHRLLAPGQPFAGDPHLLSATVAEFDRQIAYMRRHYTPVSAEQVVAALRGEAPLPRGAVLVTFDDAYRDVLIHAWPVLQRHRVPALLFVPTAFPATDRLFWWDEVYEALRQTDRPQVRVADRAFTLDTPAGRHRAARVLIRLWRPLSPAALDEQRQALLEQVGHPGIDRAGCGILSWTEVAHLAATGVAVGLHTRTHPALPAVDPPTLEAELERGDGDLRAHVPAGRVPCFAFPYGFVDDRAVPVLRRLGYVAAFTTLAGVNRLGRRDPYRLCRHAVGIDHPRGRLPLNLTPAFAHLRERVRVLRLRARLAHP